MNDHTILLLTTLVYLSKASIIIINFDDCVNVHPLDCVNVHPLEQCFVYWGPQLDPHQGRTICTYLFY